MVTEANRTLIDHVAKRFVEERDKLVLENRRAFAKERDKHEGAVSKELRRVSQLFEDERNRNLAMMASHRNDLIAMRRECDVLRRELETLRAETYDRIGPRLKEVGR